MGNYAATRGGGVFMDEQRLRENRLAIIGLTVLVVLTLVLFAFSFLGAGSLFSGGNENPEVNQPSTDTDSDGQITDGEQLSSIIAEVQTKMNNFQTLLDSPYLLQVGESHPLSEGYEVGETVLLKGSETMKMEKTAGNQMNAFFAAADKAGFAATVTVAYRTEKQQQKAYDDAVEDFMKAGYPAETARTMAAASVGSVGCSEHQLGLAVDFSKKEMTLLGSDGRTFEEYLNDTMHKYGFILSYPAGKEKETEHDANTVHYRYVGVEAATEMREKHWTLPEYRDYLKTQIDYLKQYIKSLEAK